MRIFEIVPTPRGEAISQQPRQPPNYYFTRGRQSSSGARGQARAKTRVASGRSWRTNTINDGDYDAICQSRRLFGLKICPRNSVSRQPRGAELLSRHGAKIIMPRTINLSENQVAQRKKFSASYIHQLLTRSSADNLRPPISKTVR